MQEFHKLTIAQVRRETTACVSILFSVPENLQSRYNFMSGQYLTLKSMINGEEIRRSYSICSSPKSGQLRVAVKEIPDGVFSAYANNILEAGQEMEVSEPEGQFIHAAIDGETYLGVAAGSGITPILSMILQTLEGSASAKFYLLYGNRSPEETIFYKQLMELQLAYPDRFKMQFVFSRSDQPGSQFGRIERSSLNYALKNTFGESQFQKTFLCGPEEMIHEVKDALLDKGYKEEDVLFELFVTNEVKEIPKNADGFTTVKMIVDDEEHEFTMKQTERILDKALENDIDAPYSCQGGICSSCMALIEEGKATMAKNTILTDAEVADGIVLTCQAHPTTPTITINFDEV